MKYCLLAIVFLAAQPCLAQKKIYNTSIRKAEKVTIKGGNNFITHADTVYIETEKRIEMLFAGKKVEKDTSGIFTTTYTFVPGGGELSFPFDIAMKFDKPILRRYCISAVSSLSPGIIPMTVDCGDYWIHATGNTTSTGITITLKSMKPLTADIYGISTSK
ncbi:hypothetical protein D3H65_15975 [Paraflavitalea soli]|uniref:Uncharacterized protein n=1 Tax=Paraflavitalea soli TaxID=2315862 RepID=A0A3B7MYL9_9BACT|nr:hypothetical protein [Paraflavitalea soli]AXY75391.1 hypothetical protein D3H65_15975 [Paraflavitalea soli]